MAAQPESNPLLDPDYLEAVAEAIAAGRLPARPDPAVLVRCAAVLRPALLITNIHLGVQRAPTVRARSEVRHGSG